MNIIKEEKNNDSNETEKEFLQQKIFYDEKLFCDGLLNIYISQVDDDEKNIYDYGNNLMMNQSP